MTKEQHFFKAWKNLCAHMANNPYGEDDWLIPFNQAVTYGTLGIEYATREADEHNS